MPLLSIFISNVYLSQLHYKNTKTMHTNEFGEHEVRNEVERVQPEFHLNEHALAIAIAYIGQKEDPPGSNAGKFVEDCLKLVGLGKGYAWCMAFVYRCYHEAAQQLGQANPCPKTAGVLDCWRKAPAANKVLTKAASAHNVPPGSQFIMSYGKGLGHTGIVAKIQGNTIHTIEGNTDANGSRTGGMVCARTRSMSDKKMLGFIVY